MTRRFFGLFPIQDWSNPCDWVHDNVTRVDRATNGRWSVVYVKLQASLDADGNCCGGKANWYREYVGGLRATRRATTGARLSTPTAAK